MSFRRLGDLFRRGLSWTLGRDVASNHICQRKAYVLKNAGWNQNEMEPVTWLQIYEPIKGVEFLHSSLHSLQIPFPPASNLAGVGQNHIFPPCLKPLHDIHCLTKTKCCKCGKSEIKTKCWKRSAGQAAFVEERIHLRFLSSTSTA